MSNSPETQPPQQIDSSAIREILGTASAQLIDIVAQRAQRNQQTLFLVGGVIRDLLLKQRNLDLDFVLESDAIHFAEALAADFGGAVHSHKPFGTATWTLDAQVAEKLKLSRADLPDHLDFARARSESYARPTALPAVTPSSIDRDLRRRDFSLNTLALQLSPAPSAGMLLDVCGGFSDLQRKLIRVLHDDSFVDDPTRILRALRFAQRYGFGIEPKTADLMQGALPMLARITGIRLCNEIELILQEDGAADVILRAQDLGVLKSIHPAFQVSSRLEQRLTLRSDIVPRWAKTAIDDLALRWSLLLADIGESDAQAICRRLDLSTALTRSVAGSARLVAEASKLSASSARPSEITRLLDGALEVSLLAAWIVLSHKPAAQQSIDSYCEIWRRLRPGISGDDLKDMGIPPGPRYKHLLGSIRSAWIDGDINSPDEEADFLQALLAEER